MVRCVPNQFTMEQTGAAEIFQALAAPVRLAVVERLSIGPASTTELARPFEMALPSFLQHLGVLEKAGIVTSQKTGRTRVYQLAPDALRRADEWLAVHRPHWERRLDQLDALLLAASPAPASPAPGNPDPDNPGSSGPVPAGPVPGNPDPDNPVSDHPVSDDPAPEEQ